MGVPPHPARDAALHCFDSMADGYDASFTGSVLGRALRDLSWARMDALFSPAQRILELGCGTGEDAIHLARRGLRVTAVDASARMIDRAREKARRAGMDTRIAFHCLPMEAAADTFRDARFDGVVSNFGALNCVSDLGALTRSIAERIAPGGKLLWVIMGRYVPWEWAWYLTRGDLGRAFRRLRRGGVPWRDITIRYPSPRDLRTILAPHFEVLHALPLGFALPPSYAAGWMERFPRLAETLFRLERVGQHAPALAHLADHYLIEAERIRHDAAPRRRP